MTWIQTLDGAAFDILAPDFRKINPGTIAVCMARTCRYKGHCREFYSVAQHSLVVCELVGSPDLKLPALLHDAHEVYSGFGDVARPAKQCSSIVGNWLRNTERDIDKAIARRFGFNPELLWHPHVKHADAVAMATERRDIMCACDREWDAMPESSPVLFIEPMDMDEACRQFMARLYELWGE